MNEKILTPEQIKTFGLISKAAEECNIALKKVIISFQTLNVNYLKRLSDNGLRGNKIGNRLRQEFLLLPVIFNLYLKKFRCLPGSTKTKRLRKKQKQKVLRWYTKYKGLKR